MTDDDVVMESVGKETEASATAEDASMDLLVADIFLQVRKIERNLEKDDERMLGRNFRKAIIVRKRLVSCPEALLKVFEKVTLSTPIKTTLLQFLNISATSMDIDDASKSSESTTTDDKSTNSSTKLAISPENTSLLYLLVLLYLIDTKNYKQATQCAESAVKYTATFNRRTMDIFNARILFYYSLAYERDSSSDFSAIRGVLFSKLQTATNRIDQHSQITLLNLLLRNFLEYNLYDQANKLVSKSSIPESIPSYQQARYHYFLGRIKAVRLEYSEALENLQEANRKAPNAEFSAKGFKISVRKLICVVQLLIGDIPTRTSFNRKSSKFELQPYLALTQAVRVGSVKIYNSVIKNHAESFKKDKTFILIQRIRQNVIKTGLKMICFAYSKILLKDVCSKLHFEDVKDAEGIVAKAIKDGVIEAEISHEGQYLKSFEHFGVYESGMPANSYHQRIQFCNKIHYQAVKAMRYPEIGKKEKEEDDKDEAAAKKEAEAKKRKEG